MLQIERPAASPLSTLNRSISMSIMVCGSCQSPLWSTHKPHCECYVCPKTCTCEFHLAEIESRSKTWGFNIRQRYDDIKVPNPHQEEYERVLRNRPTDDQHIYIQATPEQHSRLNRVLFNQTVDQHDIIKQ